MKSKLLILIFLLLLIPPARAIDLITATVIVTNTAGTTNGQTLTVNGNVRTWTNSVVVPGSQILTNSTIGGAATNMYLQVATTPFTGLSLARSGTNGITLQTAPGGALTVTLSAGWGSVTLSTNVLTSARIVRVPVTVENAGPRAEMMSQLTTGLNDYSTNKFYENATLVQNLLGLTNAQTVAGIKMFTNAAGQWFGIISNSPAISGVIVTVTNGVWRSGFLVSPTLTNGVNYGAAFRSPGTGSGSEQFGTSASASGVNSMALGAISSAAAENSIAIGRSTSASSPGAVTIGNNNTAAGTNSLILGIAAVATGDYSIVIGDSCINDYDYSVAIGVLATTTATNQIRLGTAAETVSVPGALQVEGASDLNTATNRILTVTNTANIQTGNVGTFTATNQATLKAGQLSAGTNTFTAQVEFTRKAVTSLANGVNAAVPISTNVFVEVSGPSAAFTLAGLDGGRDGRYVIIVNQTGFDMTVAHQSGGDPTAANRIVTTTGADRVTTGNGTATFLYSAAASRWLLINFDP